MATELTIDSVKDFIAQNDGKVKNSILVAHFRNFLNDPSGKAGARQTFKDCVNAVAVVKTENGEKYVQLKKKYRSAAPLMASTSSLEPPDTSENNSAQASPSHHLVSSFDTPIVPSNGRFGRQNNAPPGTQSNDAPTPYIDDDGDAGLLSFGPPPSEQPTAQVDPTVTSPTHRKPSQAENTPPKGLPQPHLDSSGVFRVPFPPQERKTPPKRANQSGPPNSVEQMRLNFQNNNEDTASIQQSEASVDSNKEQDIDDGNQGNNFAMDPTEKQWMLMAAKGDMLELRRLLDKDPNLAEKRDFVLGYTALHWGAKKGNEDLVRMFADIGVDVNVMSNGGYTPMHLAAMHGHEKIVQILIEEYEADPRIRNYSGKQPRDYLKNGMSLTIQKLLFGNDGNGSVRDFAAGLRPRLDSVRKSKRLGNAISGGVGVLGALVRGKATSNEDVSSLSSSSPSVGRKASFSQKSKKKKGRKWSTEQRPSISLLSNADEVESGFVSRTSSSSHEGMRRGNSASPIVSRPNSSGHRSRGDSVISKRSTHDED